MTSRLIREGLSDHLSSKGQGGVLQVMDCSATRIPSSSMMGRHPQPTGGPVWVGSYPSAEVHSVYSIAPADRAICFLVKLKYINNFLVGWLVGFYGMSTHWVILCRIRFYLRTHIIFYEQLFTNSSSGLFNP